jgi:uncharacterized membrane protein
MKKFISFIKTTALGGLIFLAPVVLVIIIVLKAIELLKKGVTPLAERWHVASVAGEATITIIVSVILVLICFIAGMIANSTKVSTHMPLVDMMADKIVPGYEILKAQSHEGGVSNVKNPWQAIILRLGEEWAIAFIVDQTNEDFKTVYIPDAPRLEAGHVRFLDSKTMEYVPISIREARQSLMRFGLGGAARLAEGRKIAGFKPQTP